MLTESAETHASESGIPRPELVAVRWLRICLIAVPLIILNTGWIANSEMKTGVTEVTISSLFIGVTFILFVLTLLNLIIRAKFGRSKALNQPELIALYTMLSMSSVVAGVGHFGFFTTFLANPFHYQSNTNGWEAFWHLLPSYIGPRDPDILRGFYLGHSSAFSVRILSAWAYPLITWSLFFLVLLWTTLCFSAILRKRWEDEEHLPFPIVALPLEMTREGGPLYKSKVLWAGFAIPLFLHSLNSLNSIFPTVPSFKINSFHDLITDTNAQYPWTGAASVPYLLHASGIGFGYLINTDVSFSLWFLYLARKLVDVLAASLNWRDVGGGWSADNNGQFPCFSYQSWGSWLALCLSALWMGRQYFKDYLRRAWKNDKSSEPANEPMSARSAVVGFVGGYFAMCAFVWASGGTWWLPVAFIGIYLVIMITLSRIRAETAVVCSELLWVNPQSILTTGLGSANFSHTDLAHISTLTWFNLDYRAAPMPHQLEGIVALRRAGGKVSPLIRAIMFAAAVAMVSALLWDLQLYYVNGASTGNVNSWRVDKGSEAWNNLQGWLHNPKGADPNAFIGAAAGFAITVALAALRSRFVGFPLHPAAYALNMTFANDFFWCDMLVAWIVKSLILRYGGVGAYRKALPFFLGLILGDYVTGSIWSIIGTVFHLNLFRTFAI